MSTNGRGMQPREEGGAGASVRLGPRPVSPGRPLPPGLPLEWAPRAALPGKERACGPEPHAQRPRGHGLRDSGTWDTGPCSRERGGPSDVSAGGESRRPGTFSPHSSSAPSRTRYSTPLLCRTDGKRESLYRTELLHSFEGRRKAKSWGSSGI